MSLLFAAGTVVEAAFVIGFALSFSTLLAYSVISGVIWLMQPRNYNEADASPASFAASRRVLASQCLVSNTVDRNSSGRATGESLRTDR